jgi:hypothetical protein
MSPRQRSAWTTWSSVSKLIPTPRCKSGAFELLQCIDTMHRAGLRSLNELLRRAGLQRTAVNDPEVRLLFDLYDPGEGGDRSRAEAVVESLRSIRGWGPRVAGGRR